MGHERRARFRLLGCLVVALLLAVPAGAAAAGSPPAKTAAASDVRTITSFSVDAPVVALTFDAGSDRGNAAQILDTLAANGIKASFSVTGIWAQANPDLVQRMAREGHTLVNHSWDHPSFPGISAAERASQLHRTEDLVRQVTGKELRPYFRPPYGAYDQSTLADLSANGYTINLLWTIDTLGWNGASVSQINQRVMDGVKPGAIILLHVGEGSQDAAALPAMIQGLRDRGYSFASVDDFVNGTISTQRFFPETGHWVKDNFLWFWNNFGGLPVFGYPITDLFQQDGMTVQYFERTRFELQPGAWPAHHDVLLGLLGVELTAGRGNEPPFRPAAASSDANCTYYAQTGHRLCWGFRDWWNRHGGLTVFGYPISEEFTENGITVQYFERARFEWHPENQPPWNVLLAHFGRMALALHGGP